MHQLMQNCLLIVGLLICTLISENQGLEKSRTISNPTKTTGLQTLIFFRSQTWKKSKKIKMPNLKKSRFAETEILLRFEIDSY